MLNNLQIRKIYVPLQSFRTKVVLTREHSSVGLEHLPYKQRVGGSTPSAPTKAFQIFLEGFFLYRATVKSEDGLSHSRPHRSWRNTPKFFHFRRKKDIFAYMIRWYAIRVSYGRVMKFSTHLQSIGIECFVPMCKKTVKKAEKTETQIVPAVSNLCFVHASRAAIDDIFLSMGDNKTAHYIWDKSTRQPIFVPDKQMQGFIQISRVMSDDVLYLNDITSRLREGQRVRVLEGPFKGVEGVVMRVKRSRRVIVDFPGLLAIATTYIQAQHLELL